MPYSQGFPLQQGSSRLDLDAIVRNCGSVPSDQVHRIVDCLTHHETPNRDFVLPESGAELTFTAKPLIHCEDGRLLLFDPAVCRPPACFEALAGAIYNVHTQTFSEVGTAVGGRFLIRRMNARNVRILQGTYQHFREGNGECDAVIETDDCIIFCELKIKSLTRAARGRKGPQHSRRSIVELVRRCLSMQSSRDCQCANADRSRCGKRTDRTLTIEHRGRRSRK